MLILFYKCLFPVDTVNKGTCIIKICFTYIIKYASCPNLKWLCQSSNIFPSNTPTFFIDINQFFFLFFFQFRKLFIFFFISCESLCLITDVYRVNLAAITHLWDLIMIYFKHKFIIKHQIVISSNHNCCWSFFFYFGMVLTPVYYIFRHHIILWRNILKMKMLRFINNITKIQNY